MPELLDWLASHDESFRPSRLASLYSDFQRQKAVNPDGYRANVTTWLTGLRRAVRAGAGPGDASVLALQTGPKLLESLTSRAYGTPAALGAVLQEGVAGGQLLPAEAFLQARASVYDSSWIPSAAAVVNWALGHVGLAGFLRGPAAQGSYAILENLEDVSGQLGGVLDRNGGRIQRLIPMPAFRKEAAAALGLEGVSELDASLLLTFLARDKKCITYSDDVVKVHASGEQSGEITKEDADVASLKALSTRLEEQEAELQKKIEVLQQSTKERLALKDRSGALRQLRSCKAHEAVLERRSASSRQVADMLINIEQAADQIEIVKAMEGSARVLRGLTAETGGIEHVEQIMDQLQEETDKADEIGTVIRASAPGNNELDEAEIDDELERLEAESKQREEAARDEEASRNLAELPSVPAEQPARQEPKAASECDLNLALNRLSIEEDAPREKSQEQGAKTAVNAMT